MHTELRHDGACLDIDQWTASLNGPERTSAPVSHVACWRSSGSSVQVWEVQTASNASQAIGQNSDDPLKICCPWLSNSSTCFAAI